jgi:hypothetical protein
MSCDAGGRVASPAAPRVRSLPPLASLACLQNLNGDDSRGGREGVVPRFGDFSLERVLLTREQSTEIYSIF